MNWLSKKGLPLLMALAAVLLAAKLAALVVDALMPPLPTLECKPQADWRTRTYPFVRAFGLVRERHKPARPAKPAKAPPVTLSGYELTMTAVGHPSMAIIVRHNKSRLLQVGDKIDGFELKEVYTDRVKLVKNGRAYWLSMKKKKSSTIRTAKPKSAKNRSESAYAEQIRKEGNTYYIPRELLREMHDLRKIFKYISIRPIYRNNKLIGFGVSQVKKGSVFDKMGLRKRDIIQKVDGKPITDEAEAFKYFNNLDELSSLALTIKRGHRIMELHYEIF